MKYNTTFDQFSKIEVNGDNEHPLYTYLKSQQPNEKVQ
jgi:glutathione peroxidase